MNRLRRTSGVLGGLALSVAGLVMAGCGSAPRPVEVTEVWTSGDEQALGIEAEGPSPAPVTSEQGPARDD